MLRHLFGEMHFFGTYFLTYALIKCIVLFPSAVGLFLAVKAQEYSKSVYFLSSLVYLYYFYSFRLYKHFSQAIYRYGKRSQSCILADAKSPDLQYSVSAAFLVFSCLNATLAVPFEASLFVLLFCVKQLVVAAACFFSDEYLANSTSRNLICGHPGTVFGANHGQVAFRSFCSVFSGFQFPLETPDSAKVLLRNALLRRKKRKKYFKNSSEHLRKTSKNSLLKRG